MNITFLYFKVFFVVLCSVKYSYTAYTQLIVPWSKKLTRENFGNQLINTFILQFHFNFSCIYGCVCLCVCVRICLCVCIQLHLCVLCLYLIVKSMKVWSCEKRCGCIKKSPFYGLVSFGCIQVWLRGVSKRDKYKWHFEGEIQWTQIQWAIVEMVFGKLQLIGAHTTQGPRYGHRLWE